MENNNLVDQVQKKFGGTFAFYSQFSSEELEKLLTISKFKMKDKMPSENDELYYNFSIKESYPEYYQLFKKQIQYLDCVDVNIKIALSKYSHGEFVTINQKLRSNKNDDKDIKRINYVFKNIPPIEKDIIVYRGINFATKFEAIDSLSKSYASTSLSKNIAESFIKNNCCLISICIPKGSSILPMMSFSRYPQEKEILLPTGGTFTPIKDLELVYHESKIFKNKSKVVLKDCELYVSPISIYVTNDVKSFVEPIMHKKGIDMQGKLTHYIYSHVIGKQYKQCNVPYLGILKQITNLHEHSQAVFTFKTNKCSYTISVKDGKIKKIVK
jgi:hypothetical protein